MPQITLTIKRKWFDMIAKGEKKEEYREIKPYYDSRFATSVAAFENKEPNTDNAFSVTFRNGYAKDAPELEVLLKGTRKGKGKTEWGAEQGKEYYVLELGAVVYCSQNYCDMCGERTEPNVHVCEGCF